LKPDGFFLEVKVRGADLDDWQAVLDRIASLAANPVYTVDGVATALPPAAKALRVNDYASPLLQFRLGSMVLSCRFLTDDCVEFDFLPRSRLDDRDYIHLEIFCAFSEMLPASRRSWSTRAVIGLLYVSIQQIMR
jgi:hypothetical protein